MSSKKSKKKKHKKEERVLSSSSHEEKKERDSKRVSSPRNHKHHHHHHHHHKSFDKDEAKRRRATDSSSTKNISPSKTRLTKTDARERKSKEEASSKSKSTEKSRTLKLHITQEKDKVTAKRKHEYASPTISGENFSKSPATNNSSSKELERQKLVASKSVPEKPRPAHGDSLSQEQRRMQLKRSLSTELHADAKRRDTNNLAISNSEHQGSQADVLKEMRKKLVSRRSKEFNQAVGAKSSHDKTLNDHFKTALPAVKHADTATKPKLPERQDESPCSSTVSKISFKISKKASTVKTQTNTGIWNVHLGSSDSRAQCNSQSRLAETVVAGSSSTNTSFVTQHHRQKPQKVLGQTSHKLSGNRSPHPSRLSTAAVQQVPTDKLRDVSTPSNTSSTIEHFQKTCSAFTSAQEQRQENHLKTLQKPTETFDCDQEMQLVEELHLARSERRLELNLVENCGELTCMDIDPPEEGASVAHNEGQHQQSLLIVLDTNVLLSHLEFVKKIRSNGLGALGFPTLLIPWVVLQELDYLKSGKLSSKVEDKARPAVHYIYSCLKNQEPRLLGQSMQQASQAICGPGVVNNDDRVLDCCLQYQVIYPESALVLCTDDKNLCSKALLSGVKALSKADLVKEVEENRLTILNQLHVPPIVAVPVVPAEKVDKLQERRCSDAVDERQLSECISVLESCLQGALSEVLEEEMKGAFGDLWTEIVYVKPPWSLEGVLKCFRKHWIAVFGNIIKRSLLSCVEMLIDYLCSHRTIKHSSVLSAVRGAAELLSALAGRSQYSGRVDQALSTLYMLQQKLQSPKAPVQSNDDDEDSLMAEVEEGEAPPSHACHQQVWALFESIWNNVCQISSSLFSALQYSPGAAEPSLRATEPPPQEALSCLLRLSTALKQLLEALQRMLSVDSTVQDAQLLLSFIQTSEIAAMEPQFTAKDLFDCVSQQEYREKLRVGGAQLSELSANLDHCAAVLSSWP